MATEDIVGLMDDEDKGIVIEKEPKEEVVPDTVAEPKPEPQTDQEDEPDLFKDDGETGTKMVPLAALHESRANEKKLKERIAELEKATKTDPLDAFSEDEPLTVAKAKELFDGMRESSRQEQAVRSAEQMDRLEREFMGQVESSGVNEALSYENVCKTGLDNLSRRDNDEVMRSANPPKELYRRCLMRTPKLLNAARKDAALAELLTGKKRVEVPKPKPTLVEDDSDYPDLDAIESNKAEDIAKFLLE